MILVTTMLVTTTIYDFTEEHEEEEQQQLEIEQELDRYSNSEELSNETICMSQTIVNRISFIQETNNIVLCDKNRRIIVEEICEEFGRSYNIETALQYVNCVLFEQD